MVASKYFSVRAMNDGALCRDVVVNFPKVCTSRGKWEGRVGNALVGFEREAAISVGNLLQEMERTPKVQENVN